MFPEIILFLPKLDLAGVPEVSGANFSLDGRTALVIGGTSGIGLEIARGFQAAGARVVVASRDAKKVESSVAELKQKDARSAGYSVDAS